MKFFVLLGLIETPDLLKIKIFTNGYPCATVR